MKRLLLLSLLVLQLQGGVNYNVVTIGTSLTVGEPGDAAHAYPVVMKTSAYLRNSATGQSTPTNKGKGGRMVIGPTGVCTVAPTDATTCLDSSGPAGCTQTMTSVALLSACVDGLLVTNRMNVLVLSCCTNDIGSGGVNPTSGRLLTGLDDYVAARKAAGWKVVVLTVAARAWGDAGAEPLRQTVNTHIRAMTGVTLADIAANAAFDAGTGQPTPAYDDATYYIQAGGDRTHFTNTGYDLMAQIVAAAINTLPKGYAFPMPGTIGR